MGQIHSSAVSDKVLVQNIVAALSEVHTVLGPGLTDTVYEEALALELGLRKFNIQRQAEISIVYKNVFIGRHSVSFLVEGRVMVEFQTEKIPIEVYQARLLAYLRAAQKRVALLVDFNVEDIKTGVKIAYLGQPKPKTERKRRGLDEETRVGDPPEEGPDGGEEE